MSQAIVSTLQCSVHRYSNSVSDYNDQSNCVAHNGSRFDFIKATGWITIPRHISTTPGDLTGELPYEDLSLAPFRCNIELASEISCLQTVMSRSNRCPHVRFQVKNCSDKES